MTRHISRHLVRHAPRLLAGTLVLLGFPGLSVAQGGDLTLFVGAAYPVYDERLTLRPSVPSLPGAEIGVTGDPRISAAGGLVAGGALAFELGVLGIEGRLDSTQLGLDVHGARYDIRATSGPLAGVTGSVTVGDGELDAERLNLLSINARLRTPGPIGLFVSGGFTFLPDINIGGSVPISAAIAGIPIVSGTPRLTLQAAPDESGHRYGVNAGAGIRIGGSRVALMAEARIFYFRDYELRFAAIDAPDLVTDLLDDLDPIRFDPTIINAQAGLVFRF